MIGVNHRLLGILGVDQYHAFGRVIDQPAIQSLIKPRHDSPPSAPEAVPPKDLRYLLPSAATGDPISDSWGAPRGPACGPPVPGKPQRQPQAQSDRARTLPLVYRYKWGGRRNLQ